MLAKSKTPHVFFQITKFTRSEENMIRAIEYSLSASHCSKIFLSRATLNHSICFIKMYVLHFVTALFYLILCLVVTQRC